MEQQNHGASREGGNRCKEEWKATRIKTSKDLRCGEKEIERKLRKLRDKDARSVEGNYTVKRTITFLSDFSTLN
jgi:hypothetical protein